MADMGNASNTPTRKYAKNLRDDLVNFSKSNIIAPPICLSKKIKFGMLDKNNKNPIFRMAVCNDQFWSSHKVESDRYYEGVIGNRKIVFVYQRLKAN